jgi:diaminopimelate decarboxylase
MLAIMTVMLQPDFQAALSQAAAQFGTPFYAYDWAVIERQVAAIKSAFVTSNAQAQVLYAMKANPALGILRRLHAQGIGFEAVSGGELERALRVGATGRQIVFNGPGKLEADIVRAQQAAAVIVLDAPGEVARVAALARANGSNAGCEVLLRVNPGLTVSTHDHLATGNASSKFGIPLEEVAATVAAAEAAGLRVLGLHLHIGSAITDPSDYRHALERVSALADQIGPRQVFDMGGGFGLDFDLAPLAQLGFAAAARFGAELWTEPGRALVARAGVLVARVLERKHTARRFAVLDAGMSELIRPMLYQAEHAVLALDAVSDAPSETLDLAGPACESGDILVRDATLPVLAIGDLVAILEAGAYGASMASHYLTRPRPPELLWIDGGWQVLRRRDTIDEILAAELSLEGV